MTTKKHSEERSSNLDKRIWSIAANIPKGKVATYQGVAEAAGSRFLARRVGTLMRGSPDYVP